MKNVEHDFAALPIAPEMQTTTPTITSSTDPIPSVPNTSVLEISPGKVLDLYKLSGPLQRIITGSPFIYSPTARK